LCQTEAIQRADTARADAEAELARQRARAEAAERLLALDRARGMSRVLESLLPTSTHNIELSVIGFDDSQILSLAGPFLSIT